MTIRAAWTAVLCMFAIGAGTIAAAPAPPPVGLRIESLTHDARRPLRAGDVLTVTLRGSAGIAATFDIFGVASGVRFAEVRPGVYGAQPALYQGRYTVRAGDVARTATVLAKLATAGQEVIGAAGRPVTIDTQPPEVTLREPAPDARLTNLRPNLVASLFDGESSVNPAAVRLLVNGRNVTAETTVTETSTAYNPQAPFSPGPVRVELLASDRAGNTARNSWSFAIAPPNDLIRSVTINPATALRAGDVLTVVVAGAPGAAASFSIGDLPVPVPMRESRTPGLYFGSYEAQRGQRLLFAAVRVTLEKDGRRNTVAAATGVTIVGMAPPAPTNIATGRTVVPGPRPEARVVVRGRSRAGYRILGRISHDGRLSGDDQGSLQEVLARVGDDGTWQLVVGPFAGLRGRFVATIVAIDPAGQQSPPVVVELNPE